MSRPGKPCSKFWLERGQQVRWDHDERQLLDWASVSGCSVSSIASIPLKSYGSEFFHYLVERARVSEKKEGDMDVSWEAGKAWEDCGIALAQRALLVQKLLLLVEERARRFNVSRLLLVDLGAGTGRVFFDLYSALQERGSIERVAGILVEQSIKACAMARQYSDGVLQTNASVEVINADMRELFWDGVGDHADDLVLVVASQSMHEVPWEDKELLLSAIQKRGWDIVIAELEGNHDRTASYSPALISSVCTFYGQLVESVISGGGPSGSHEGAVLVVEEFLIQEALRLLTETRVRRGNYHLKKEGWEHLLEDAGFEVRSLHYGDVAGFCPPLWIGAGLCEKSSVSDVAEARGR